MKTVLKMAAAVVLLLVVGAGGLYGWASFKDRALLSRTLESHTVDFPVPFPLTDEEAAELAALQAGADAAGGDPPETDPSILARERALERGRHLVEARYACVECHGQNFGGGVMIDDPMIGRILGPNLTTGAGGKTAGYTPADWDRAVRHGIKPDGTPSAMPSEDYRRMSDRELSDIVAYIQSAPPVDNEVPPVKLGPLGTMLMAFGQIPLSADMMEDHQAPHPLEPPPAEPTVAFGEHLAATCSGCHHPNFAGGPVPGGPPDWAPAANLTPHADGLAGWTFEQFVTALRDGRRPDGAMLREPMTLMMPYAQRMTDVELEAMWAYFQSVPPLPDPAG